MIKSRKILNAVLLISICCLTNVQITTAQSIPQLQTQVILLQQQLSALLAQAQNLKNMNATKCEFKRDLFIGQKGEDVRCLQRYLNTTSASVNTTGNPGSLGFETDYYGPLLKNAVTTWQKMNEIPATGYFGAVSKVKYESLHKEKPLTTPPLTPPSNSSTQIPQASSAKANEQHNVMKIENKQITTPQTSSAFTTEELKRILEDNSPARQVVMGSKNIKVLRINLSGSNAEDVRVNEITITDTISNPAVSSVVSFNNLRIIDQNGIVVAGPKHLMASQISGTSTIAAVTLSLTNPIIIPKNQQVNVNVIADVGTFNSGSALSKSSHVFSVEQSSDIQATGVSSNLNTTITGAPIRGNAQTIVRTKITIQSVTQGAETNRIRTPVDDVALIEFTADPAYNPKIQSVTIKLTGQAISNAGAFSVNLIEEDGNDNWGESDTQTCNPGSSSSCSVTFTPNFLIGAGSNKKIKLRVNATGFTNQNQSQESLTALIENPQDVLWEDGSATNIPLEARLTPFTLSTVSYN